MILDPTLAIESVIGDDLRDQILARFPSQRGATVADLLDMEYERDGGLEHTEPAWSAFGDAALSALRLARPDLRREYVVRLVSLSMLTFVLADDLPLVEDRVRDLASDAAARIA